MKKSKSRPEREAAPATLLTIMAQVAKPRRGGNTIPTSHGSIAPSQYSGTRGALLQPGIFGLFQHCEYRRRTSCKRYRAAAVELFIERSKAPNSSQFMMALVGCSVCRRSSPPVNRSARTRKQRDGAAPPLPGQLIQHCAISLYSDCQYILAAAGSAHIKLNFWLELFQVSRLGPGTRQA